MYYVYILKSKKDGSFYVGCTIDLKKRLQEHQRNNENTYSNTKKPWEIDWYCCFREKTKAYDFEKYLKSGSGIAFRKKRLINKLIKIKN